jgi:hypothetical protein
MKILAGILIIIALASGCILAEPFSPPPAPELTFTPGQGSCATSEPRVAIWSEEDAIKFAGSVSTPTPCYTLDAAYKISEEVIIINIQSHALGGPCIQCIGAVPFEGELKGLPTGNYTVRLVSGNTVLAEKSTVN